MDIENLNSSSSINYNSPLLGKKRKYNISDISPLKLVSFPKFRKKLIRREKKPVKNKVKRIKINSKKNLNINYNELNKN